MIFTDGIIDSGFLIGIGIVMMILVLILYIILILMYGFSKSTTTQEVLEIIIFKLTLFASIAH